MYTRTVSNSDVGADQLCTDWSPIDAILSAMSTSRLSRSLSSVLTSFSTPTILPSLSLPPILIQTIRLNLLGSNSADGFDYNLNYKSYDGTYNIVFFFLFHFEFLFSSTLSAYVCMIIIFILIYYF